jgi:hypothetical protein
MGSFRIGAVIYLGRSLNSSSAVGTALLITQTQFAKLFEFCTWASAQNKQGPVKLRIANRLAITLARDPIAVDGRNEPEFVADRKSSTSTKHDNEHDFGGAGEGNRTPVSVTETPTVGGSRNLRRKPTGEKHG